MNAKQLTLLIGLFIGAMGLLLLYCINIGIGVGVLLMIWSNNIWLAEKDKDD